MKSSIISYPERGKWGSSSYRGNCSGHVVRDFLEMFHIKSGGLFVDPAVGGGTSRDVAEDMAIPNLTFDLKAGFNLLRDDLASRLSGRFAHTLFFHPPYLHIVKYSNHPDCLSNCKSVDEFMEKMGLALSNIYDAVEPLGHYAVLMGNVRQAGEYIPLAPMVLNIMPGRLREEIIKVQHNCVSDRVEYSGRSFVPIRHEHLYIMQKDRVLFALDYAIDHSVALEKAKVWTWRNLIKRVLVKTGSRPLSLDEIYARVEGSDRAKANAHWREKVRQTLQLMPEAERISRGMYQMSLAAA
jgi:hypothetical protein